MGVLSTLFNVASQTSSTLTVDWSSVDVISLFQPVLTGIMGLIPAILTVTFTMLGVKKGIAWIKGGVKKA